LALDAIQEAVPVPVLGVIEPGAEAARGASRTGDVLVIATDATVQSHAYAAACKAHGLRALEMACPLLVPLVEEGWTTCGGADAACAAGELNQQEAVTVEVIRIYLAELMAEATQQGMNPDVLVLGCTHYPLLRPLIEAAVPAGMKVIDSAEATAETVVRLFGRHDAENPSPSAKEPSALESKAQFLTVQNQIRCFATDSVEKFERLGSRFLNRPTGPVELVDLGG
jgi:glutamate racemase